MTESDKTLNQIFELYKEFGQADYIGETVTQTQHMLECAQAAEVYLSTTPSPFNTQIILAALFHDIGHLVGMAQASKKMDSLGTHGHERIGASFLRQLGITGLIPDLVEKHVEAKRYLTCTNPDYLLKLSDASRKTLKFQGGPMTQVEADDFERDPNFNLILLFRSWDDQAKENCSVKELSYYREMLKSYLTSL